MKVSIITNVLFWIYNNSPLVLVSSATTYVGLIILDKLFPLEKEPIYEAILTSHKGTKGQPIISTGPMSYVFTDFINEAKNTLYLEAYALNSDAVIDAILKAQKRGVTVMLIIDYQPRNCHTNTLQQLIRAVYSVKEKKSSKFKFMKIGDLRNMFLEV